MAIANGIGKGSGRADNGFDLGAAILAARKAGLLINGGGHPRAAGFTVAAERLEAFRAFMAARDDRSTTLMVGHWAFILALTGISLANGEILEYDPSLSSVRQ